MLIELLTGGGGSIEIDGQWQSLACGHLLWHYPGDMTVTRSVFNDPYRCLSVLFELPERGTALPRLTQWPDPNAVRSFTRESVRRYHDEGFDRTSLALWILGELNYRVQQWEGHGGGQYPAGLERALTFIRQQEAPMPASKNLLTFPAGRHHIFMRFLNSIYRKVRIVINSIDGCSSRVSCWQPPPSALRSWVNAANLIMRHIFCVASSNITN